MRSVIHHSEQQVLLLFLADLLCRHAGRVAVEKSSKVLALHNMYCKCVNIYWQILLIKELKQLSLFFLSISVFWHKMSHIPESKCITQVSSLYNHDFYHQEIIQKRKKMLRKIVSSGNVKYVICQMNLKICKNTGYIL